MTEILFSFDTEDFTMNHASDAVRDEAHLLHKYGVRGNFNIVGYLAREFVRYRRWDVLDELKNHTISFHSLGHTYHPTINEYTDIEDFDEAYAEIMRKENEGIGMVRAATGADFIAAACPPGDSLSYVAMYAYADLGIPLYVGSLFYTPKGEGVFCCNSFHTNYDFALEEPFCEWDSYSEDDFIEELATRDRVVLYNHPNKIVYRVFWDAINYCGENKHPMHEWEEPPRRTDEETALYYARLESLIKRLQSDCRFRITNAEELCAHAAQLSDRRVTKEMLPEIRENLRQNFRYMSSPVNLSLCDVLYAAKHFMVSDEDYIPGKVHGFLYSPEGCAEEIRLTRGEALLACECISPDKFIPARFEIDDKVFGPADLLFALLDMAIDGTDEAICFPKEQQCDISEFPYLCGMNLKGSWMHADTFEDTYLSDRMRLQAWTIRKER